MKEIMKEGTERDQGVDLKGSTDIMKIREKDTKNTMMIKYSIESPTIARKQKESKLVNW